MKTTFVAISNMSGIACASDTDRTIYGLSKSLPVAVAVNPRSPIPWEDIINDYLIAGEIQEHEAFAEYGDDFERRLSKVPVSKSFENLTYEEGNIIFMGYGKEDLFPCIYDVTVSLDPEKQILYYSQKELQPLSHENEADIRYLGDLESVSTLIWGTTDQSWDKCLKELKKVYDVYKRRVRKQFEGTQYEQEVEDQLARFDAERIFYKRIEECSEKVCDQVLSGIETFSIQDMVDAAETLVNAEVRLDHLSAGLKAPSQSIREIAVLTRIEGLTWIKHSLFAL